MTVSQSPSLSDDEIEQVLHCLRKDEQGRIQLADLEQLLLEADEQSRLPSDPDWNDFCIGDEQTKRQCHEFLSYMLGRKDGPLYINVDELRTLIRQWNIPSLQHAAVAPSSTSASQTDVKLTLIRRARAWWKVFGPECVFLVLFFGLQLGLGLLHALKYALDPISRLAFGWGVPVAKFCAGALYPTLFFLLLSMSRWTNTFLRQARCLSRLFNSDYAKSFHVFLAVQVLVLASVHAMCHITGTFVYGQHRNRQWAVNTELKTLRRWVYRDFLLSTPGVTGFPALLLLYVISLMSLACIRRKVFKVFQAFHLLMFPFIALLVAHGTAKLLQYPMLGFVLAFPTLMILIERLTRLYRSFRSFDAHLVVVDRETVNLQCDIPLSRFWRYRAGQYVFLQVPALSRFQWHPFTISLCTEREMHLHIKTNGRWTGRLRALAMQSGGAAMIKVGIDGPYGAPAQRFYEYDQAIIIGAGIGITPFSAILHDLQVRSNHRWNKTKGVHCRRKEKGSGAHKKTASMHSNCSVGESISSMSMNESIESLQTDVARAQLAQDLSHRITTRVPQMQTAQHALESGNCCSIPVTRPSSELHHNLVENSCGLARTASIEICDSRTDTHTLNRAPSPVFPAWTILSRRTQRFEQAGEKQLVRILGHDHDTEKHLGRRLYAAADANAVRSSSTANVIDLDVYRRVDMHWIVRDRTHLAWFADLMNSVSQNIERQRTRHLDMRVYSHVTQAQQDSMATYVFRWLLEQYRVVRTMSKSPLTGLIAPAQFGRPNFDEIFHTHYEDMVHLFQAHPQRLRRVGVFYCGHPTIAMQLADLCYQLTLRGMRDGSHIKYYFQKEVFS